MDTTGVADSQVLTYNSSTSTWVAADVASPLMPVSAKTANYTATTSDKALTYNGSSLTATIPDPTTVSGRMYIIKNLHSTDLTVVSAGTSKTIDGAASVKVPQYLVISVVSDGTTWQIYGGRSFLPTSTYKPIIVDTSSGTGATFRVYTNIASSEAAIWADSSGTSARPALRATVGAGSTNIFEGGAWIAGGFYKYFNVSSAGSINKLGNVDFTLTASTSNPQDAVSTNDGIVSDTGTKLTFQKRASGTPWPAWHYQPLGYFGQTQTKTANYTVDFKDTVLIGNGSSITFTLPDPTASGLTAGRKFEIKNIHSTALSVVSAGSSKTIDGVASISLAQWDKVTVVTDGAQWLVVGGRNPFTVATSAPSAPVSGDIWFDIS